MENNTGNSSGPHVRFELNRKAQVNPPRIQTGRTKMPSRKQRRAWYHSLPHDDRPTWEDWNRKEEWRAIQAAEIAARDAA